MEIPCISSLLYMNHLITAPWDSSVFYDYGKCKSPFDNSKYIYRRNINNDTNFSS